MSKLTSKGLGLLILILLLGACKPRKEVKTVQVQDPADLKEMKIVSLCNTASETVFSLGFETNVVGVDVTSKYPAAFDKLPKLGHYPNFNVEAIAALSPDLVIARRAEIKPELKTQLEVLNIELLLLEQSYTRENTTEIIEQISRELNARDRSKKLTKQMDSSFQLLKEIPRPLNTIFIYSRGNGPMMVAGSKNQMNSLIKIAGGKNPMEVFDGYKPLTPESLVSADPEVIIVFQSALGSLDGIDGLLETPGMEQTRAGKNRQVLVVDEMLASSFGPRLGKAALVLNNYYFDLIYEQ